MFVVLAMRIVKMPFNTPFEMLKTDFRCEQITLKQSYMQRYF